MQTRYIEDWTTTHSERYLLRKGGEESTYHKWGAGKE